MNMTLIGSADGLPSLAYESMSFFVIELAAYFKHKKNYIVLLDEKI